MIVFLGNFIEYSSYINFGLFIFWLLCKRKKVFVFKYYYFDLYWKEDLWRIEVFLFRIDWEDYLLFGEEN